MRVERGGAVGTDDSEILEPVIVSDAVYVVEDQGHLPTAPNVRLAAKLTPPLFEPLRIEATLQVPPAVR
jgi:hypothetical protein